MGTGGGYPPAEFRWNDGTIHRLHHVKEWNNTNVVVKIDTSLATPVLYAMLHEDHGIIGKLEFPGPDNPVYVNGQMVAPPFNVTGLVQDVTINIQKPQGVFHFLRMARGTACISL